MTLNQQNISYAECLENYHVDNQTVIYLWRDVNKYLEKQSEPDEKTIYVQMELIKFVNCILSRLNICNQRLPTHFRILSLELLNETRSFLTTCLTQKLDQVLMSQLFSF
jgi:hypothetical protein